MRCPPRDAFTRKQAHCALFGPLDRPSGSAVAQTPGEGLHAQGPRLAELAAQGICSWTACLEVRLHCEQYFLAFVCVESCLNHLNPLLNLSFFSLPGMVLLKIKFKLLMVTSSNHTNSHARQQTLQNSQVAESLGSVLARQQCCNLRSCYAANNAGVQLNRSREKEKGGGEEEGVVGAGGVAKETGREE